MSEQEPPDSGIADARERLKLAAQNEATVIALKRLCDEKDARIRELEAQVKTARQEALAFGKEVYFGHNCADRLGARPPCECELCANYRALSRNDAQEGESHED